MMNNNKVLKTGALAAAMMIVFIIIASRGAEWTKGLSPEFIAYGQTLTGGGGGGTTYHVTVVSSFGTTFSDCFRFGTPNAGDLSIDLLRQTITFRRGQLNTVEQRFKAVSRSGQALAIMYYGEAFNALNQLVGEAVNEFGDTFVFSGPVDTACVPSVPATAYTRSPYQSDPSGRGPR